MSSESGNTVVYGTEYNYTTIENQKTISSGVASFEPSLGGDENPLRQPISYQQKIKGALTNMFYLEQPFGESYFPAPSVGYRKVTIKNIDETGSADAQNETGWIVKEFYTAKEFPTIVSVTAMQKNEFKPRGRMDLFGGLQLHELALSQGYAIYLNDMHGKARKEQVFDKSSSLISSSEYIYSADGLNAGEWQLNNSVKIIDDKQEVKTKILGRDIEMFTDMRESDFTNLGTSINLGVDVFPVPFWPWLVIPHWPKKNNDEMRLFRSACIAKVIQSYGILQKVIQVQNGSQVSAENVAFDPNTGDVLVTKTHNEFKQDIYSVNIPAYRIYKGMSGAYKTLGTFIRNFKTDDNGVINTSPLNSFLQPGDELMDARGNIYWIIESKETVNGIEAQSFRKRVINKNGNIATAFQAAGKWVKIIRSGNRNLISASAATIVCQENPIKTDNDGVDRLKFSKNEELKDWRIIDAKATEFNENWTGDWNLPCNTCPAGYQLSLDGEWCEKLLNESSAYCYTLCPGTNDALNSVDGAFIKETLTSPWVNKKTSYWMGTDCNGASQFASASSSNKNAAQNNKVTSLAPSISIPNSCNLSSVRDASACSPLNRSGVWFCSNNTNNERTPLNQWIGIETYLVAAESKIFYIGYGANDRVKVYVNDYPVVLNTTKVEDNYKRWNIIPVSLNEGKNRITIETYNEQGGAAVGVEIYNNTYAQLINETGINRIFSTDDLLNTSNKVYTYVYSAENNIAPRYTCSDGSTPDIANGVNCDRFRISQVNPYVQGFKGNWRPLASNVFQVNRSYGNEAIATALFPKNPKEAELYKFNAFLFSSSCP
jgi:hypothetical protein